MSPPADDWLGDILPMDEWQRRTALPASVPQVQPQPPIPKPVAAMATAGDVAKEVIAGAKSAITDVPAEDVARTVRGVAGGPMDVEAFKRAEGWANRTIEEQQRDQAATAQTPEEAAQPTALPGVTRGDVRQGVQQAGHSAVSSALNWIGQGVGLLLGAAAGAAAGSGQGEYGMLKGAAKGAWKGRALGGLVGGAIGLPPLFFTQKDAYLEQVLVKRLAENPNLTTPEWQQEVATKWNRQANISGGWEVGTEAADAILKYALLSRTFNAGKFSVWARKVGENALADVVAEVIGETVTQKMQHGPDVAAGFAIGDLSWKDAYKQVAAQTVIGSIASDLLLNAPTRIIDRAQFNAAKIKTLDALRNAKVPDPIVADFEAAGDRDAWEAAKELHGPAVEDHINAGFTAAMADTHGEDSPGPDTSPDDPEVELAAAQAAHDQAVQEDAPPEVQAELQRQTDEAATRVDEAADEVFPVEQPTAEEAAAEVAQVAARDGVDAIQNPGGAGESAIDAQLDAVIEHGSNPPVTVEGIVAARQEANLPALPESTLEDLRQRENGTGPALTAADASVYGTMPNVESAPKPGMPPKAPPAAPPAQAVAPYVLAAEEANVARYPEPVRAAVLSAVGVVDEIENNRTIAGLPPLAPAVRGNLIQRQAESAAGTPGAIPVSPAEVEKWSKQKGGLPWKASAPKASVPLLITRQQTAELFARGYKQADIDRMKPAEAGEILAQPATKGGPREPSGQTPETALLNPPAPGAGPATVAPAAQAGPPTAVQMASTTGLESEPTYPPNSLVLFPADYASMARLPGHIATPLADPSDVKAVRAAFGQATSDAVDVHDREISHSGSMAFVSDAKGKLMWVANPSGKTHARGTPDAAYALGDLDAHEKSRAAAFQAARAAGDTATAERLVGEEITRAESDRDRFLGYVATTKAEIASALKKKKAGERVQDTDFRYDDWKDYISNLRRHAESQQMQADVYVARARSLAQLRPKPAEAELTPAKKKGKVRSDETDRNAQQARPPAKARVVPDELGGRPEDRVQHVGQDEEGWKRELGLLQSRVRGTVHERRIVGVEVDPELGATTEFAEASRIAQQLGAVAIPVRDHPVFWGLHLSGRVLIGPHANHPDGHTMAETVRHELFHYGWHLGLPSAKRLAGLIHVENTAVRRIRTKIANQEAVRALADGYSSAGTKVTTEADAKRAGRMYSDEVFLEEVAADLYAGIDVRWGIDIAGLADQAKVATARDEVRAELAAEAESDRGRETGPPRLAGKASAPVEVTVAKRWAEQAESYAQSLGVPAVELVRLQWNRNAQGDQAFGTQNIIAPINAKLRRLFPLLAKTAPSVTHVNLSRTYGNYWRVAKGGSFDDVIPDLSRADLRRWHEQVDSFSDPAAIAKGRAEDEPATTRYSAKDDPGILPRMNGTETDWSEADSGLWNVYNAGVEIGVVHDQGAKISDTPVDGYDVYAGYGEFTAGDKLITTPTFMEAVAFLRRSRSMQEKVRGIMKLPPTVKVVGNAGTESGLEVGRGVPYQGGIWSIAQAGVEAGGTEKYVRLSNRSGARTDWIKASEVLPRPAASDHDAEYQSAVESGDAKKAQAMVDAAAQAAGYTVGPLYHGTQQGSFNFFNSDRENANAYGPGFYFTASAAAAGRYSRGEEGNRVILNKGTAPTVITAYLRMAKPFHVDKTIVSPADLLSIEAAAGEALGPFDDAYKPDGGAVWTELVVNHGGAAGASRILRAAGFDGIVAPSETVAFSAGQIKRADAITRDDAGKVIPLAQRFDRRTSDLRYSAKDRAVTASDITAEVAARMVKILNREGFDIRGTSDLLAAIKGRTVKVNGEDVKLSGLLRDGKFVTDEWRDAYAEATAGVRGRVERLQEKKAGQAQHPNVNRARIRELGTTTDLREAGYITSDGGLIDLSGKREGGSPRQRALDHREAGGTSGMQEFMAEGNVRMDYNSGSLDIYAAPTTAQLRQIETIARDKNGELVIDLQHGLGELNRDGNYGRTADALSKTYDAGTIPRRILNDIRSYYGMPKYSAKDTVHTRLPNWRNIHGDFTMGDPLVSNLAALDTPGGEDLKQKLAATLRTYPQAAAGAKGLRGPDAVFKAVIHSMKSNLRFLWNHYPAEFRPRAMKWYDGAHRIAQRLGAIHVYSTPQAAGVLAVFSPQTDWLVNVSRAIRLIAIDKSLTASNRRFDRPMEAFMRRVVAESVRVSGIAPEQQRANMTRLGKLAAAMRGQAYKDMPPEHRARMIRFVDEMEGDRSYQIITPEGFPAGPKRGMEGDIAKTAWGDFGQIEKALAVLADGSRSNISENLGGQHKVRNFFNNIVAPNDPAGYTTIDTHATAAALMEPLAGGDPQVKMVLGAGGSSVATGTNGHYPVYEQAYRDLAEELSNELGISVLPRQIQSVTWEAVRGLFDRTQKNALKKPVRGIWREYAEGNKDLAAVHRDISHRAGGINRPDWADANAGPADDEGWLGGGAVRPAARAFPARAGVRGVDSGGSAGPGAAVGRRPAVAFPAKQAVPGLDAEYLAAVKAGDTAKAQQMVDAAARAAGYNVGPVYHGTDADFTQFDPEKVHMYHRHGPMKFFFAFNKAFAEEKGQAVAGRAKRVISAYLQAQKPGTYDAQDRLLPADADHVRLGDLMISVRRPEQIKSAEPVERDASGRVIQLSERFNPKSLDMRFSAKDAPSPFYSALSRAVEAMPLKQAIPGDQMLNKVRGLPGVKAQEVEETGLSDWLAMQKEQNAPVTKEALQAFLRKNGVRVKTIVMGQDVRPPAERAFDGWSDDDIRTHLINEMGADDKAVETMTRPELLAEADSLKDEFDEVGMPGDTKFKEYAPPGGEPGSYREILLTLPVHRAIPKTKPELWAAFKAWSGQTPEEYFRPAAGEPEISEKEVRAEMEVEGEFDTAPSFRHGHWSEPNVLAHMLVDERRIPLAQLEATQPALAAKLKAEGKTEARALHMIEGQSDWHQKGAAKGYNNPRGQQLFEAAKRFYLEVWVPVQRLKLEGQAANDKFADIARETGFTKAEIQAEGAARGDFTNQYVAPVIPDAPFKGDAWKRLIIRSMLKQAQVGGYDLLTWSTGEDRFKKWGSERVEWKKSSTETGIHPVRFVPRPGSAAADKPWRIENSRGQVHANQHGIPLFATRAEAERYLEENVKGSWVVAASEQVGGEHLGQNIEEQARARRILLEQSGTMVRTKDDLLALVSGIIRDEDENPGKAEKLTNRIWDRMQTEDEGSSMPRREFFEFLYDKSFVQQANDVVRRMDKAAGAFDASVETTITPLVDNDDGTQIHGKRQRVTMAVHAVPITPTLSAAVAGGQPLYSAKDEPQEAPKRGGMPPKAPAPASSQPVDDDGPDFGPPLDWDEILAGAKKTDAKVRRAYRRGVTTGAASKTPILSTLDVAFGRRARKNLRTSAQKRADLMENDAAVAEELRSGLPADPAAARKALHRHLAKLFGPMDATAILRSGGNDPTAVVTQLNQYLADELSTHYANRLVWLLGRKDFTEPNLHPDVRPEFARLTSEVPYEALRDLRAAAETLKWFKSERIDKSPEEIESAQKRVDGLFETWKKKVEATTDWRTIQDWHDRAAGIQAESNRLQWVIREGLRESRSALARKVNDEIAASAKPLPSIGQSAEVPRVRGWTEGRVEDLKLNQTGRALQMAGGNEESETFDLLSTRIEAAETRKLEYERQKMDRLLAREKELGITDDDWIKWQGELKTFRVAGQPIQMTVAEVMDLYATIQDEENLGELARSPLKRRRLKGVKAGISFEDSGQAEDEILALTSRVLSARQKALVQFMVKELTDMGEGGNTVSRALYGKDLFTKPVYWPRERDYQDRKNEAIGDVDDLKRANLPRVLERLGLTKSRVKNVHAMMVSDVRLKFANHVKQMAGYTHLTLPVGDAMGVLGFGDGDVNVSSTIRERYGSGRIDEIRTTFERVAGLRKNSDDWGDIQKFMAKVERHAAVAILWGRLSTILFNRIGGSVMAMAEIEHRFPGAGASYLKHLGAPLGLFWTAENRSIREKLMANGFLGHRWGGEFINVLANHPTDDVESFSSQAALKLRKFQEWGMRPMATAEQKNAVAAYKVFRSKGLSEAEAVAAVEQITRATQNPSSAMQETALYQQVKRAGLGVFLPFLGQPTVAAALLQRDLIRARTRRPGAARGLAMTVFGLASSVALTAVVRQLLRSATAGEWPPDDEDKTRAALQMLNEALDLIVPGAGKVADGVTGFYDRGVARDTSLLGRLVESSLGGFKDLQELSYTGWDEERAKRAADRLATATSILFGLPYGGPAQSVKAAAGLVTAGSGE